MTPTTPPAIPSDIPQDVIDAAASAYFAYCDEQSRLAQMPTEEELLNVAARAIMAERERAVAACERQKASFASDEYATPQPLGGLMERFACDQCIEAIREGR